MTVLESPEVPAPVPTGHSGAGLFSSLLGFVLLVVGFIYGVAVMQFQAHGLLEAQGQEAAEALGCDVVNEHEELVAQVSSTCYVLRLES